MRIHTQIHNFIGIWIALKDIAVSMALLFAPLIVLMCDSASMMGECVRIQHLVFMLALWRAMYVSSKALRAGMEPTGWENLCAGFAAGSALVYSLSFCPLAETGMLYCLALIVSPIALPLMVLFSPMQIFWFPAALLVIPILLLITAVCMSPLLLPATTLNLAWKIRKRMPIPSNLLPAGVAVAFISISILNLPLTSAEVAHRLVRSPDRSVALFAQQLLKPLGSTELLGIKLPSLDDTCVLGRPFYKSRTHL
jgi:hypothetical protein